MDAQLEAPVSVEIACPKCPEGILAELDGGLGYACTLCDYDDTICAKCGKQMIFAAEYRGVTCGGLSIVGARACALCGVYEVCRRSKPADAVDWCLAKSGRSLTAGGIKVRAEAAPGVAELMARIVRLPELELEVERLRTELAKRGTQ